jgi:hypothetical protein
MDAVATAKLALDASGFDRGLAKAQSSVSQFAKQAGGLIAGAFAFDKIISGFSSAIEKGDQLQDIAEKFGVSASKLQLIGNAASVYGSGIEQVSTGLNKLSLAQQKALAGDQGLAATFAEVGINLEQLKSMKPEDILLKISDSFASGANEGRQFIIVNDLLGKSQTDLIKVLNQGAAAITEQGEAIGVWSDDTIAQLSAASDSLKTFQNTFIIMFGQLAAYINPAIESFRQFAEELGMVGYAIKTAFGGNFKEAAAVMRAAGKSHMQSLQPKAKEARADVPLDVSAEMASSKEDVPLDVSAEMASSEEEKRKLDKRLYDEEIYNIEEESRLKENHEKTLFDRMVRDAEYARDEKKRILEAEKEAALKYKEMADKAMESSGSLLDRIKAAAEREGRQDIVENIEKERANLLKITDRLLLDKLGQQTGERKFMGMDERMIQEARISGFAQMEANSQRTSNDNLFNQVDSIRMTVQGILEAINARLSVPILRSAY